MRHRSHQSTAHTLTDSSVPSKLPLHAFNQLLALDQLAAIANEDRSPHAGPATRLSRAPEQLRQTNTPRLTLAQVGPRDPQSAHRLLVSIFSSPARVARCRSLAAALTLVFWFAIETLRCRDAAALARVGVSGIGR